MPRQELVKEICDRCGRDLTFGVPTFNDPLRGWRRVQVREFTERGEVNMDPEHPPLSYTLCFDCLRPLHDWMSNRAQFG